MNGRRPLLLFAPGAGASSSSPWMQTWAHRLAALGELETLDYPYMVEGKKRPDPLPTLVAAHRQALERLRRRDREAPVVLLGKSMGGRVGCHLAAEVAQVENIRAVVCFGYPLRSASGKLRDEVLRDLTVPALFIQGTRDPLCPLELLAAARATMRVPNEVVVIPGGDHSLTLRKRDEREQGVTQAEWDERVFVAVQKFIQGYVAR